jgi:hypothetical protein
MTFRELIQEDETLVRPWVGGRALWQGVRGWTIQGALPAEHGWHAFRLRGRKAHWLGVAESMPASLRSRVTGYLAGDRLVRDDVRVDPAPEKVLRASERVSLVEPGLDRFARIAAGRPFPGGPLVFAGLEMPLGPEGDVLSAFLDREGSVLSVKGVPPALDAAFRVETWRRDERERAIAEAEERVRLEREREDFLASVGSGESRREMAHVDFDGAARRALAVGGAELLDHRPAHVPGQRLVRFRLDGARFACTCEEHTLRIVDAGICLTDHETGERGDDRFTLESLPAVIREAEREGVLVVFRA